MDLQNAWNVALKDFKIYRKKSNVIYATVALPLIVGVGFPFILNYALHKANKPMAAAAAPAFMDAFSIWFVIGAVIIPTAIASYSLVGEKIQKSLEPMLATPMTDGDILLGKTISGLLIPVAALYAGSIIFMALMDYFTRGALGYFYYPNWHIGAILLAAPLAALLSVEVNVIISSRLTDVRSAQQLGSLLMLPFLGLFLASELNFFALNNNNLIILAGAIALIDVGMFFVAKATFQRDEILTRWK
ncbi:MAG: ABC transporter permease subunit [Nitrososphaerota archaeon]|nr:ABC transporter permease subunit [Nitrososphaerota archaeon]